ncbi:efflux RND transporter permease subunit [Kutzneria buriramensis]|uniref:HAE1 family hydrophobic/amphiphilic exporter-1 n=1 Tax=Kutzneria buriramensis TaxID=1045776 RepID=A0A3E0HD99_9PSEU|nr:efflux RND transporter permease subunit [Kutzneria buriramensis]REH42766.1 HAE1 family hydrophobic/amphiphilic exporter-1 [Kutzneria buriramensis]
MTFLTRLSLANRGLVALVALIALGFGAWAIPSLQRQLLPSLSFPAAVVVSQYPGASPEIVQDQVTKPIEDALRSVPGQTQMNSTSSQGSSSVTMQFDFGTNLDNAVNKMSQAVNQIAAQLPANVKPNVIVGNTDDLPVIVLAASSDADQQQLAAKLTSTVVPELQGITGVRDASVTGARAKVVTISLDNAKLAAAGLSSTAVTTALRANGTPTPAGTLNQGDQTLTVQIGQRLSSVDDVRNLYLTPTTPALPGRPAPQPVKLGDVAQVTEDLAPATSLTRTNGKDSLGVSVTKTPDGNAVDISNQVRNKISQLETDLGSNAKLTVVQDQAPAVNKAVDGLTEEGLLGLAFAVLVILIFLLSVRSTIVTAVSIPLSVVIALIVLWTTKTSLNLLTLGGLTIAIGRVVDDSIVVLENIKRHLSYGEDKKRAVLEGTREVAGAVTASTLTTVAVFAPIAVVGGLVGELFAPFGLTVTVALLASLLVALTIVPVLAYWFLKPAKEGTDPDEAVRKELRSPLQRVYVPVIRFATRRRLTTVLIAIVVLFGTLAMGAGLKTNFLDGSGENTINVSQALPVGSSLTTTDAAAKRVETVIQGVDGIDNYQVTVGAGGGFLGFGGNSGTSKASYAITIKDGADLTTVQNTLRDKLNALPNAGKITVGAGGGGDFGGSGLSVVVNATDENVLRTASDAVQKTMSGISGVTDVTSDLVNSAPEVQVSVDRQAAAKQGLSDSTIGQAVQAQLAGSQIAQLTLNGTSENVMLRTGSAPGDLDALKALQLPGATGAVRLDSVATVQQTNGPTQIKRINGSRSATVSGTADSANTGRISADLTQKLKDTKLPAGATYSVGGVSQQQSDAFGNLGIALVVAVALVFLIMVAVFRSLIQPLVLLVSIPFAATGAIAALLISGIPLGLPSLIGVLMLVGIVVTNAIVLMDLINKYRQDGMSIADAVVEGGRRRLRPILMTAAATIFALLPMAVGLTQSGGFISQPLAVVVIGGLVSSTLLTLLLVPTLYTMVENRKEKFRKRREAKRNKAVAPEQPELVDAK